MIKLTANAVIVIALVIYLTFVSCNMKQPYSHTVYEYFSEPMVRVCAYLGIFVISEYNPVIALLAMMIVVFLHMDYNNLSAPLNFYP